MAMMMRICILLVSAILLNGYKLSRENNPETTCFYAEDYPLDQEVESVSNDPGSAFTVYDMDFPSDADSPTLVP